MPMARFRAQCTDFKTSLGPLQKHWELLLPLCVHTRCSTTVWLELHLQVMQCSPLVASHCFYSLPESEMVPLLSPSSPSGYWIQQLQLPSQAPVSQNTPWNYTLKQVGKVWYMWMGLCFLMFLQVLMKTWRRGRIMRLNSMCAFTVFCSPWLYFAVSAVVTHQLQVPYLF